MGLLGHFWAEPGLPVSGLRGGLPVTGAEWTDAEAFAAYGLDDATITALHAGALEWADDLAARLLEESDDPHID
ncbi:hypothetical protein GCM10010294_30600 [Streptomyces griseoloalbus]|uniref:hypothetical protein n=1 Tax=Streptomyces griseoloalbus TaxID=67303 RepID=UPI001873E782|nr:hypothetical protein GCM10010294_30600 [Streptomyces griseoloalbus]